VSVAAGALALGGVSCRREQKREPLTAEGKAYVSNLKLTEVAMKATESYAGQVITEILGKVTNAGNRTVYSAEVSCIFYDSINQMVLRERVPIVKTPLKPGETRSFRLPFDDIPSSWNSQMPQLVIAQIRLS
jgi:hypothetical protein